MKNRSSNQTLRLSRRDMLKMGLLGGTGLAFRGYPATAATAPSPLPHPGKPTAKAVIQIWLWGGPCHIDTFDPKPDAGSDYCGRYTKPASTNVDGIRICEMLPKLAAMADRYALIRGMTHGCNAHETASYMVMSGNQSAEGTVNPSMGAVVSYQLGYRAGYKGLIPPYVTLTSPQGRFSEAGFLGSRYQPFSTGGDPRRTPFAVEGIVAKGITEKHQQARRQLLEELDTFGRSMQGNPLVDQLEKSRNEAYSLILGEARKTFDLSTEPDKLREDYGKNSLLGQSCLQARKLVEAGVPFITINSRKWDTHKKHFEAMQTMLPDLDRALSTLLLDLEQHGLLDSTIVWVGGEFGRSPKIQQDAPWNGGRGHHGKAFCHLLAGGGFQGGTVVGATDKRGIAVTERPVYPWDLLASMYLMLGIDPAATLPSPDGRRIPISPLAASADIKSGGILTEIMPREVTA